MIIPNGCVAARLLVKLPPAHPARRVTLKRTSHIKGNKGTLTRMNPPEEITPLHAERLVTLLSMMGDLSRDGLAFLVGHMASKDIDLAIDAFGALMGTDLPQEGM